MAKKTIFIDKTITTTMKGELSAAELCDIIRDHFNAPKQAVVDVTEYSGAIVTWSTTDRAETEEINA